MPKVHNKWTNEEIQLVFKYLPAFGKNFEMYTQVINRPKNQIKSFYYNHLQRMRSQEKRNAEAQDIVFLSSSLANLMHLVSVAE
ncbi:SANT/Myb_domain [Hexamita inflata]|uniref:SANT/Myb domain n=1 Tax=Hexamita inflata TaxID=28002 RepID=A0AA86PS10_9EUKA|nr:SANT/Myb domain [Hexamita inflata]CAI9943793.1 SANT/Myb domain [Hexamita inflata]